MIKGTVSRFYPLRFLPAMAFLPVLCCACVALSCSSGAGLAGAGDRSHSIRYDTMRIEQPFLYYQFVQNFDSARVLMFLGEVRVCTAMRGCATMMLNHYDPLKHRPMLDSGLSDLAAKSFTGDMIVYPGDTIYYYTTLQEVNDFSATSASITIPDTVGYCVDLIDRISGDSLTIDSIGVRPHLTLTEFGQALISNHDTALISSYVVGPRYQPGVLYLRVRPFFKGDRNRYSISRWDLLERYPLSQWGRLVRRVASSVIDSLSLRDRIAGGLPAEGYSLAIHPLKNTLAVKYTAASTGTHILKIYDTGGGEMLNRKMMLQHEGTMNVELGDWPPGSYKLVLFKDRLPMVALTTVITRQ